MKATFVILLCFLHSCNSVLLASNKDSTKIQISINCGINYNFYTKRLYTPPDTNASSVNSAPSYVGGSRLPSITPYIGISINYKIFKNISFKTGIDVLSRQTVFVKDLDSVYIFYPFDPYYKMKYGSVYFEIPVQLIASIKKFKIGIGGNFSVFQLRYSKFVYENYAKRIYYSYSYTNLHILEFYPIISFTYLILNKRNLNIEYFLNFERYFYSDDCFFQTGLSVKILKF